jgi:hypothetical protein
LKLIKSAPGLALLALLTLLWNAQMGCGGGGGGGTAGATAILRGIALLVRTNARPDPQATISAGGTSVLSDRDDGTFRLENVPVSATQVTVTFASGGNTFTRTIPITLTANQTLDLGTVYLSTEGYNATVSGRVVTVVNGVPQGVGGANVTIAGTTVVSQTGANAGRFTINNLPVGLGNIPGSLLGEITATDFERTAITSETLGPPLQAGANNVGDLRISRPVGTTPPPPHTIAGRVTVQGNARQNVQVSLILGGNTIGTTSSDANGNYTFWVVPGTYTVRATFAGMQPGQANVTLQRLDTPVTAPNINLTP